MTVFTSSSFCNKTTAVSKEKIELDESFARAFVFSVKLNTVEESKKNEGKEQKKEKERIFDAREYYLSQV